MINVDDLTKKTHKEHSPNWPQIQDHPCRVLRIWEKIHYLI